MSKSDTPAAVRVEPSVRPHSGDWMSVHEAEQLAALWCAGQPLDDLPQWRTAMQVLARELAATRAALKKANDQAERFERGWYLRGDALEKLEQWARAYPLKVFPEPLREEWQRAAALLSEKGLSLDRMSASNMRHVINGVRETAAEGLKA